MTHRKRIVYIVSCLIMLVVFSFGVTSNTLVAAKSLEAETKVNSSFQKQKLSTPELIEQAFANGEITAEQRILYLAYAVYDVKSLPPQFHGTVPWEGTAYVREIQTAMHTVKTSKTSALSPSVEAEFILLSAQAGTVPSVTIMMRHEEPII